MDCKKIALSVGALAVALVGCGEAGTTFEARNYRCAAGTAPPCETDTPATSDADRTVVEIETTEETTYTYIVETIDIPEAADNRVVGFNLDGLDSGEGSTASDANCETEAVDFINSDEPNHVGVDNALQGLVGTIEGFLDAADCPGMTTEGCLGATLQAQILDGSLLLIMRVTDVNDFEFDSEVQLQLFLGALPEGEIPVEGSGGGLAPDQEFSLEMPLGEPVAGDIFAGRLRASTPTLTITVDTGDFMLPLMISNAEVRFNISETGLGAGQIGGFLTTESVIEAASMIMPGIEDTVRSVIESFADINPTEGGFPCEALSVGLSFGATTAVCTDC